MDLRGTIIANTVSGLIIAIVAALIGIFIARAYTEQREEIRAGHERDLAAVAELYRAYGQFFAAWKVWNAHLRSDECAPGARMPRLGMPGDQRRSELLTQAAEAEGGFEALLVRLTLEHHLDPDQRAMLWCLRKASKQLRNSIRDGTPLLWWRDDIHGADAGHDGYRAYQAFKMLNSTVAEMLLTKSKHHRGPHSALEALLQVTGPGREFTDNNRLRPAIEKERIARRLSNREEKHWEWLVVAEQLLVINSYTRIDPRVKFTRWLPQRFLDFSNPHKHSAARLTSLPQGLLRASVAV
jgi:hypothetical protein